MNYAPQPIILELGNEFYDAVKPAEFSKHIPRFLNHNAADSVGLSSLLKSETDWKKYYATFNSLPDNLQNPLALRYHGHQFQHYNPDLGDGRGFLFAQLKDQQNRILDLGTKGSGQTPYSRQGDGRLTLKGAYREALATEMLESLGVNTSKTFSFFETGDTLERNDEPSPTRGAVLTRLSHSHIRFGTFQRLKYFENREAMIKLLEYCIHHYYPNILQNPSLTEFEQKAEELLKQITIATAKLTAQWMMAGFVHGVLNTDNMNITGESFDYGPYRFLPYYDPTFTAAYFDRGGLYCYGRQPQSTLWNLHRLGQCFELISPSLDINIVTDIFSVQYSEELVKIFFSRLNLKMQNEKENFALITLFFKMLEDNRVLFEQAFFDFYSGSHLKKWTQSPQKEFYTSESAVRLIQKISEFEVLDLQKTTHAYFAQVKACTLLIGEIESMWDPIAKNDDWSLFENKINQIRSMRGLY